MFKKLKRIWNRFYNLIILDEEIECKVAVIVPEVSKHRNYRNVYLIHTNKGTKVLLGSMTPSTEYLPIQDNIPKPETYSYDNPF
jgi:hypothetical protein